MIHVQPKKKSPEEVAYQLAKNPGCFAVRVTPFDPMNDPPIPKNYFLVPIEKDLTMRQFIWVIRRYIKLKPEEALFFYVCDQKGNVISHRNEVLLAAIHADYCHPIDHVLDLKYTKESTFG